MEMQLLKKTENTLQFILKEINPETANTLRRIMIAEVPVLAIEEVNFIKNESALYDEILAHRLGLTPLVTDLKSYELKDQCSCEGKGCAKCQLLLSLKTKGPCTVYASELQSQDPRVKPVFGNIPITLLVKNQKLELEATAILGQGKQHAKFSPCIAHYTTEDEKDFTFFVESFGQLSPLEIIETAIALFDEKLNAFEESLKGGKESKLGMLKKEVLEKIKKPIKVKK